ncbi:DUF3397 domain-containing protein [Alteribacillus sp. HJP-4]|uniref:DUF3397 domain-containing protein n=1 Tax=Alteribacillus sp. HJP-4 TaxID=2775394 RepID=UPI0035CD33F5
MTDIAAYFFTFIITLPFLGWYLVYIVTVKWTKRKGKAVRLAADLTTIFFIIAVHILIHAIWSVSLLWLILLTMLFISAAYTILQIRSSPEAPFYKLLKGIWRLHFFLFSIVYILLVCYGLTISLLNAFLI